MTSTSGNPATGKAQSANPLKARITYIENKEEKVMECGIHYDGTIDVAYGIVPVKEAKLWIETMFPQVKVKKLEVIE